MIKGVRINSYRNVDDRVDTDELEDDGEQLFDEVGTNDPSEGTEIKTQAVIIPQEQEIIVPGPSTYWNIFCLIDRCSKEPEVPNIWSGIVKGTFGFIYGPAKSGKTILCENLGMSIAAGKETYLGKPLNSSKVNKVLFVSMEEFWQNRTERNAKQLMAIPNLDRDNFPYMVVDETFPSSLLNEKSWQAFENTILSSGADFVIVDSLTRMIRDEIEKSNAASQTLLRLKDLTARLKITLIVIHHSSKIINQPLDIANMAGSRVVGQEADFILGINKLSNQTRYFKEVSTRYKQESELVTTFRIDNDLWLNKLWDVSEASLFQTVDHRENPENEDLVLNTIENLSQESGEVRTSDVITQLRGELGKTVIYDYLSNLEEKGFIDRSKKGIIKINE